MKSQIFSLSILAILFSSPAMGAKVSAKHLNAIFSGTCKTQGQFTVKALNDAESLISIIEEVRDDEDCKSVGATLAKLKTLEQTLYEIEQANQSPLELQKLKAKESEILSQILESNDSQTTAQLESILRSIQVEIASLEAQIDFERSSGVSLRFLYQNVVESTETALSTLSSNTQCLNKNPSLLSSVVSLGSSIAAATYTTFPAYALALSAATDILGSTIEYFRKKPYQLIIRRITNSSLALEGYRCALESLSDTWCSSKDAERILNLKAKLRSENINHRFNSQDIIVQNDQEIPAFIDWLNKVDAGVTPSSTSEGERQSRVLYRQAEVESRERIGLGIIQEEEIRFLQSAPARKLDALKLVVQKLVGFSCGGSSSTGPSEVLNEVFAGDSTRAAFYLIGIENELTDNNGNRIGFCSFQASDFPGYIPDYNLLRSQFNNWITEARDLVSSERVRVMQPDALSTLTLAFDSSSNPYRIAPLDAIKKIRDFLQLKENIESIQNGNAFSLIYNDTIKRLNKIIQLVEESILQFDNRSMETALQEIARVANLENGVYLFQNRLEMVVRNTIQNYLQNRINDDEELSSQLLAADSFIDTLKVIKGNDNLALIMNDISNSQHISLNNMNALVDTFGKNIRDVLKAVDKDANETNDPQLRKVYKRTTAQFCLLLSSMPSWPEDIPKKYCIGSSIAPVLTGGPQSPTIDWNYLNRPFSQRSCGYRNFIRESKIYQDWGIKL